MLTKHDEFSYRHVSSIDIEDLEYMLNKMPNNEWIKELTKKIKDYEYCYVFYSKKHNAFLLEPWGEKDAT